MSSSWYTILEAKIDGLKKKDEEMEEKYKSMQRQKDEFCLQFEEEIFFFYKFERENRNKFDQETKQRVREILEYMHSTGKLCPKHTQMLYKLDRAMEMREYLEANPHADEDGTDSEVLVGCIVCICMDFQYLGVQMTEMRSFLHKKFATLYEHYKNT